MVVVENVYRHLSEHRDSSTGKTSLILQAAMEVGQPVVFGILIIIIVFFRSFPARHGRKMFFSRWPIPSSSPC